MAHDAIICLLNQFFQLFLQLLHLHSLFHWKVRCQIMLCTHRLLQPTLTGYSRGWLVDYMGASFGKPSLEHNNIFKMKHWIIIVLHFALILQSRLEPIPREEHSLDVKVLNGIQQPWAHKCDGAPLPALAVWCLVAKALQRVPREHSAFNYLQ